MIIILFQFFIKNIYNVHGHVHGRVHLVHGRVHGQNSLWTKFHPLCLGWIILKMAVFKCLSVFYF